MKRHIPVLSISLLISSSLFAQGRPDSAKTPTINEKVASMQKFPGYFPFYWDAKAGKLWLEIDKWNSEFLYVESLPAGIGSNDIGLDRGQLGQSHIVRFERTGPRVLLIASNEAFRANSDNADERRAVKDAFAESTLWGFEVAAEEGNRALVDATAFYLRDVHGIPGTLQRNQQGQFRLDPTRCAFYLANTKSFPKNTEVETTLTFTTDGEAGPLVRSVTPVPQAITVREHVSFVELPPPGFKPRANDPRAGYFGIQYMDFATPISEPIVKRYIDHHRLQKKDPAAAMSEPVKPIVYYVDRGAPEPVRSALIEGASWWNQAFEAAGYRNAFRVEVMPPDADPMDVRYNVIQWVHRSTRGWSYGSSLDDPRTGEIIQGRVSLGSLRDRQDFLIAQGLLAPHGKDKTVVDKIMQQDVLVASTSSSYTHLWDNGTNVIDGLNNVMKVRAAALNRFGENNIREGAPMATLEDVLVPLYMYHRYQVEAASKLIGGEDYTFSLRGKGDRNPQIIAPDEQKRALYAVLDTLKPEALALPESLLRLIPPRPPGYGRTREDFRIRTYPTFDALAPAEAIANHVSDFLLNQERAARIVEFHARDAQYPSFDDVLEKILIGTWKAPMRSGYQGEIQHIVNMVVLNDLMALAAGERASNQVRAIAEFKLEELKKWLAAQQRVLENEKQKPFLFYAENQIKRFQEDPKKMNLTKPNDPPDGQPIGVDWWMLSDRDWCDWR